MIITTTYNLYRDGQKIKEGLTTANVTDSGLTPNKSYFYQVSSVNEVGESVLSAALVVKTPYSAPTGVTLNSSTLALTTGGNGTLTATVAPSTAQQQVNWKTSDAATATVDTNGKVIAVKAGTVTITAESKTDASKKATCTVTITDPTGGG